MITRACRWAKLEFGLGDIKKKELVTLRNSSDPSKGMPEKEFISAIIAIKENNTAGYYRNLEYRLGQTIKKEKDETEKENLKVIYRQLIKYNWSRDPSNLRCEGSQNVLSPSDAPPSPPPPPPPSSPPGFPESPGPSGACGTTIDKRKQKKESIRTLTKEDAIKFKALCEKESIKFNDLNIAKCNVNGTLPRYYMKCEDNIVKHMGRDPIPQDRSKKIFMDEILSEDLEIEGAFKKLTKHDQDYVMLEAKEAEFNSKESLSFNQLTIDRLRNYPSVCQSFFVSEKEMIASNGGVSLSELMRNGQRFKLKQFEQLAKDINEMQKENLFMTDIKLQNLVFNGQNEEMVKLIDLDSIWYENYDFLPCYSPDHTTPALHRLHMKIINEYIGADGKIKKPELMLEMKNAIHQSLSNFVNYALLKTLIEATTGAEFRFYTENETCPPIGMPSSWENPYQEHSFRITKDWIKKNVKPKHQGMMMAFSANPEQRKGIIDLSKVLNFKKKKIFFS